MCALHSTLAFVRTPFCFFLLVLDILVSSETGKNHIFWLGHSESSASSHPAHSKKTGQDCNFLKGEMGDPVSGL